MAKVSFSSEFIQKKDSYADKLKVEFGVTDRVGIVTAPERFYVHSLKMPLVDLATGEVEKETRENSKGDPFEVDKTEFVGSFLCTGKDEALESLDGFDADNCPFCAAIKEYGDSKFRRPEARYASWVVKYKMTSGGDVQLDPFQAELNLWPMSQNRFDAIVRIANEHGDPMKLDLILGPCKSAQFQNYEINAGGKCYWREDTDRQKFVAGLLKANKVGTDEGDQLVKNTIARTATPTAAEMAINKVLERHALIGKPAGTEPATAGAVEFGGAAASSREAEKNTSSWADSSKASERPSWASESDSKASSSSEGAESAFEAEKPSESAPSSEDDSVEDFEDILAQLGAN